MKNRLSDLILIAIFLLVIFGLGAATLATPDKSTSKLENRSLEQRPNATAQRILSGDYFSKFTSYFSDQFVKRNKWIEANSKINKDLLKKRVVNDIYVAKNGYLLEPVGKPKQSAETIIPKFNAFAENMKKNNINVYFALAPKKEVMMEGQLPDYLKSRGNKISDNIMKNFSGNIHAIDLRSAVKPHMDEANMYFKTDHHWKAKAAFYSYQTIMNEMAQQDPSVGKPLSKNQFTWKEYPKPFYGSYARKTGKSYVKKPDTVTIAKPKFKEKPYQICYRNSCDRGFYYKKRLTSSKTYTNRYQAYLGGSTAEVTIDNPNKSNGKNLLILKDSYAHPMVQFLARNFKSIRMLDLRYYKGNVYQYAQKNNIDTVLFIQTTGVLDNKTFYNFGRPQ